MKKRGALFYIIDAFVAASIIALTMTIILSTQYNAPKVEVAEDALDNYLTYLQKTSISNTPGDTKTAIIEAGFVDNLNDNIISTIAQLILRNNLTAAQQLVADVNSIALEAQYGLNMSITIDGTKTAIMTRNLERLGSARMHLQKSLLSTYQLKPEEKTYTMSISTTGTDACAPDTCLYVFDETGDPTTSTYDEEGCDDNLPGWDARCYTYSQTSIHIIILEASIWS